MTYAITVAGSDIAFTCDPGETILAAAERAGFVLPYSCRKGVCSSCEGIIVTGAATVIGRGRINGPAEAVRFCQTRPGSNLEIAPASIEKRTVEARKVVTARVFKIRRPAPDVTVLQLRFPSGTRVKFIAGQYLSVLLDDGDSRNYSMANPPHQNDGAELHVRHTVGGVFSEGIVPKLAKGDELRVELPFGEFALDQALNDPVVLLATGTGFAPVKSIIEDQIKQGSDRKMHLYWGARRRQDIYAPELPEKWAASFPWFSYTPVLSRPDDDWVGRTGRIQQAALADYPDLSGCAAYACGNAHMTSAAAAALVEEGGLSPERFYCDAFVSSGDPVPDEGEGEAHA
jgi:CDP-4-dehydro-6-deoxyglucose reductase/3-phenylpropionate/trans-cinnamate dioxygenase ferredoxin reductase subunit